MLKDRRSLGFHSGSFMLSAETRKMAMHQQLRKRKSTTAGKAVISNVQERDNSEEKRVDSNVFSESPLPEEVQQLILEYRRKNPKTGFKRIEARLKSDHLVVVNRKQIRHVLKIHGLLESNDSSFDVKEKPAKRTRRFAADYAGEPYLMDVTYA